MTAPSKNRNTVGQYLLNRLYAYGIKHIFGVPGDYVLRFDKVIEEHPDIRFINTIRENTAGYCADAYARLRGMGVACITYGVGINISNALAQAFVESSPLVVISGSVGVEEYKKHPVRHHLINKMMAKHGDSTQLEVFKNLTVDQGVITSADIAVEVIDRVLETCYLLKKPVYIEIPRDQVDQPLPHPGTLSAPKFSIPPSDAETVKEALVDTEGVLSRSKFPIIWAGHEILRFGLSQPLLQFAEKFQIPIISTLLGKTVVDEHHPLYIGVYQGRMSIQEVSEAVHKCDGLLMIGTMMSDLDSGIFTAKVDQDHRIIANQHLLTIGHHHYNIHLKDYVKGLSELSSPKVSRPSISSSYSRLPSRVESRQDVKTNIKHVFQCLQKYLTPEHLIVSDVGDCLFASADLVLSQNSFMACAYFASLGFGVPAAVGAQIADPKRRVIAIVGDGGFQMTAMELATAVRYHLDPIIIVLNNHGYGTERVILEGSYNDIYNWNYAKIPEVFGRGVGIKVETEAAFEAAIQRAMEKRGEFYLIEVELEKLDFSPALHRLGELLGNIVKS